MSFPFVQPYFGLGNSLQTAQASGSGAGGIGGWVELGRTSSSSLPDVSSLANKQYLMFLNFMVSDNSRPVVSMRLNGDTGTNYSLRGSGVGLGDYSSTDKSSFQTVGGQPQGDTTTVPYLTVGYIANLAGKEKLLMAHNVLDYQPGVSAAEATERREFVGKWSNTTDAVDQLSVLTTAGGSFTTDGELIVLGWDPVDDHTTNFWEELASVTASGSSTNLSSGTISAKKYLWLQCYLDGTSTRSQVTFNNDTGSNYADRYNSNGGTEGTQTTQAHYDTQGIYSSTDGRFFNMFVLNNAATSKICITHTTAMNGTGSANAPNRYETVGKWNNTSDSITEIDVDSLSGNWGSSSILKVWGSD
jgi:hypothetical protein